MVHKVPITISLPGLMYNRNLTLDIFKIVLALMVIGIHSNFLNELTTEGYYLITAGIFRIAVPIFFIINGYYFISIASTDKLLQWSKRVAILYLFWTIFYAYFWMKPLTLNFIGMMTVVETLIVGYHHLWYLVGMLGAGLMTYVFRERTRTGAQLALLCFVLGVMVQYIGNYHLMSSTFADRLFNIGFTHRNFLLLGFPFFYIGFFIRKHQLFAKIPTSTLLIAALIGIVLLLGESWYNLNQPSRTGVFDNYLSLIWVCPALFLLAMRSQRTTTNKHLAHLSTAIYLIHPFCLSVLMKIHHWENTPMAIGCMLLSLAFSYVLIQIYKRVGYIL
ncbi:Surface polysaccharide O-acyltransferase, integral membrane enzyme [Vibrio gazogenes DSM 21264]|uniref:Surface polysaccharide O-acyltransferase, integral membrane enzyme n=1 Tax=Vibrio gazogenes DSM 21264 = NBRC 103151 TaxID=1123492 RepID=A0A1M5ATG6_VIBGA|nr:Surface polysaccharide O-acyltransferase, integral membrane enzyme [Vibrio gazogenes DSM 21264] [Vibrio gazogenes DSM 21264 = NBRC 103151]SJN58640.1 Serine/alanine racemase [Vibrio gazogenes]